MTLALPPIPWWQNHGSVSYACVVYETLTYDQDLPHDELSLASNAALADEKSHTDELQSKAKDLEELVTMGDPLQDAPDKASTAESHGEDVIVV